MTETLTQEATSLKFTAHQVDLAPILGHLVRGTNNLFPNVKIEANGKDAMTLTTTNGNLTMVASVPTRTNDGNALTINCKELHDVASRLSGTVEFDNGKIQAGKRKISLQVCSTENFMPSKELKGTAVTVDAKELITQLRKTLIGTNQLDSNNLLSGILLDGQNVVATDGNMLVVNKLSKPIFETQVILPRALVDEMTKCFANSETLDIVANETFIQISDGVITLTSTLLVGVYPAYSKLIPTTYTKKAIIDKNALLSELEFVSLAANQKTNIVKLSFTNSTLELQANKEGVEGNGLIDIECTEPEFKIAFNIDYLRKILKGYDTNVIEFQFEGALNAGLFVPNENDLCLLMPIQISDRNK